MFEGFIQEKNSLLVIVKVNFGDCILELIDHIVFGDIRFPRSFIRGRLRYIKWGLREGMFNYGFSGLRWRRLDLLLQFWIALNKSQDSIDRMTCIVIYIGHDLNIIIRLNRRII